MSLAEKLYRDEPLPRRSPHNVEVEQALLGAILINNEAFWRVSDFLEPGHFFDPIHNKFYDQAAKLIRMGKVADPRTVKTYVKADENIGEVTAAEYLTRLALEATTIINAEDYGRTIYDLAVRRSLIGIGEEMVNAAYDAPVELAPRDQIEEAERRLYQLAETGRHDRGFSDFATALTNAIEMANAAYRRDSHLSGLATGLRDLDLKLGGLQPSDLVILAGRPGMGKTALATNIAYNIAQAWRGAEQRDGTISTVDGGKVGFFSLEMSAEQLATRILSEQTGISSSEIRRGSIDDHQMDQIIEAAQRMQKIPLYIDQTGGISIGQLAARARRLKRQRGLDLLVIDYIQLIQSSTRRASDSRVQEVTEITTSLKALAKELNVPILALSQLSRQVESRDDKRPQLSDLRESGSIEQDADVVLFVFREEYYVLMRQPDSKNAAKYEAWADELKSVGGTAEVIIGKQRHGPTGTVKLQFDSNVTRFSDLAREGQVQARYD